ncbi:hypothetical protein HPP92_001352 [Vanilla planifolia]|nr:hypothetical protein HPP92_001352 [Vanilla planifolia]
MKQIHKQSSAVQNSSKIAKQHNTRSSIPRSAASYLLREQRLLFVLIGVVIASSLFLLHPYHYTPVISPTLPLPHRSAIARDSASTISTSAFPIEARGAGARRVTVGLRKAPLRIVVTGGAGFVGSHLVDKLIARGDSVIVIDNFFTGRKDNLVHHFGNPRFELIRHDVIDPILLEVDQIYHLACPASPVHYKYNPIKTIISLFIYCFLSRFLFLLSSWFVIPGSDVADEYPICL